MSLFECRYEAILLKMSWRFDYFKQKKEPVKTGPKHGNGDFCYFI
jgi:hypothetical protein